MTKIESAERCDRGRRVAVVVAGGLEASAVRVFGEVDFVLGRSPASTTGESPVGLLAHVSGVTRREILDALTNAPLRYEAVGVAYEARWVPGRLGGALVVAEAAATERDELDALRSSLAEWRRAGIRRELAIVWAADVRGHITAARRELVPLLDSPRGPSAILRLRLVAAMLDRAGELALAAFVGARGPPIAD